MDRMRVAELIDRTLKAEDFDTSGPQLRDDGTIGVGFQRFDCNLGLVVVGGVSPDVAVAEAHREHFRHLFALQQQARDLGRNISTGGGHRGSHYGMVPVTCPDPARPYRHDSWRCHHAHPDDITALECALEEVRRLAGGGPYQPCTAGPDCQDNAACLSAWKRLRRALS